MSTAGVAALAIPGEKGYQVADIVVDDLLEHEVLVRVVAAGMCHTDAAVKERWSGPSLPPIVLGHEGAGVVEQVGSAVRGIASGDKVLVTFRSCGACPSCLTGQPSSRFPVDKLIRQYPLSEIDRAAEDSHSGATVKPVLRL
jgi:aryl-alcohol dehydrogenase